MINHFVLKCPGIPINFDLLSLRVKQMNSCMFRPQYHSSPTFFFLQYGIYFQGRDIKVQPKNRECGFTGMETEVFSK